MKICIKDDNGIVDVEADEDFLNNPWAALDFIADTISRLQSMAIDIEAAAGDPGSSISPSA